MLDVITQCNSITNSREARKILIMYDEERMFIGDSYILINQLASCKLYFTKADIYINCQNKKYTDLCLALLKNNPFIAGFNNLSWEEIDYGSYDMVFCITQNEKKLLDILEQKHQSRLPAPWTTAVYSMSAQFLNSRLNPIISTALPPFREILDNPEEFVTGHPSELYVDDDEREWANQWLRNKGVKEHEHLFILLDSTSQRYKLINMDAYQAVLERLLNEESVKLLVFDEQSIGKESFYRQWIGEERLSKMIFAKGLGLREAICILSSDYTKLLFGPCTGLMHCASGIYNNFVRNGMPASSVPQIIIYTGKYNDGYAAEFWWNTSPLVTCLIVRSTADDGKEVVVLSDLPEEEKKDVSTLLLCKEYTSDLLINYLPVHSQELVI